MVYYALEHFFILPFRWFRLHIKNWFTHQQRCKVCGCRDKFNFDVDDETWRKVVPMKFQGRVVCLACFDDFANKKGIDYSKFIQSLCFAGNRFNFEWKNESSVRDKI